MSFGFYEREVKKRKLSDVGKTELPDEKRAAFEKISSDLNARLKAIHDSTAAKRLEITKKLEKARDVLMECSKMASVAFDNGERVLKDLKIEFGKEFPRARLAYRVQERLQEYERLVIDTKNLVKNHMSPNQTERAEVLEKTLVADRQAKAAYEKHVELREQLWKILGDGVAEDKRENADKMRRVLDDLKMLACCERMDDLHSRICKFSLYDGYRFFAEHCQCDGCGDVNEDQIEFSQDSEEIYFGGDHKTSTD